jgi:hypothetical protein
VGNGLFQAEVGRLAFFELRNSRSSAGGVRLRRENLLATITAAGSQQQQPQQNVGQNQSGFIAGKSYPVAIVEEQQQQQDGGGGGGGGILRCQYQLDDVRFLVSVSTLFLVLI